MKRKYCPTCYLEYHEQIKIEPQVLNKQENRGGAGKQTYICIKRGHTIKGAGLTLPELKELERFYGDSKP